MPTWRSAARERRYGSGRLLRLAGGVGSLHRRGVWLGVAFYGPPVFLYRIDEACGWPVSLVSVAVTCHFLLGAAMVANLATLPGHSAWSW
jgi:hypothetical protein